MYLERFTTLRGLILLRLSELRAAQEARLAVEERYLAGHPLATFERAKAIFEVLGTTVTHVGDSGAGQATKLCNPVVVAMNIQAICEGFSLGWWPAQQEPD
jgi:3-hydroxyisobutyrate dehydrogenase-like beta-hydroxyacid dehydrogenase